jgi:hypothetical protein
MNVIWKVRLEITSVLTFHIYCRIWVKFGLRDMHIILFNSCEFLAIQAGIAVLFVWVYMKLHFTRVPRNTIIF